MKCVVTGAAGFIGSHLSERLLADGHSVIGVDCFTPYYSRALKEANLVKARSREGFRMQEADLRTSDIGGLFADAEAVFHLAAQPGVRGSFGSGFRDYVEHNIMGTQRVLEWALENRALQVLVFASSASVYGDVPPPMREDGPTEPTSPYGVTKLAAEHLCLQYCRESGVPVVVLRFFSVFGPRQRPDMALTKLAKALLLDEEFTAFAGGEQERDFTYVSDVVGAVMAASNPKFKGTVINVAGGNRISLKGAMAIYEKISGNKLKIRHAEKQMGDAKITEADTARLRGTLGFSPKVRLEEGLRRQFEWARENISLLAEAG